MSQNDTEFFSPMLGELRHLRPVAANASGGKRGKTVKFTISFAPGGEPSLKVDPSGATAVADVRIINEMRRINGSSSSFDNPWHTSTDAELVVSLWKFPYLLRLLYDCKNVMLEDGTPVKFSDDPANMLLQIKRGRKYLGINLIARTSEGDFQDIRFLNDTAVLAGGEIRLTASVGVNFSRIQTLLPDNLPIDMLVQYVSLFTSFFSNISVELDGVEAVSSKHAIHAVPTIILEKVAADKALYLRVADTIDSLGDIYTSGIDLTRAASLDEDGRQLTLSEIVSTDIEEKTDVLAALIDKSAPDRQARKEIYRDVNFFIIPQETAGPFLLRYLPDVLSVFKLMGSEKLREYKVTPVMPKLNLKLSSGIDFLEGDGDITVEGEKFSISDFLDQFSRNRYITLSDGNRAIIDEKYINRLRRLFDRKKKNGKIKVSLFDLPEIEALIQEKVKGKQATHTREVFAGFNKLKKNKCEDYHVDATLRPYQVEGVKWIKYLYDNKLGGCLADDMGLGKTLQTIAVLSMIYPGARNPTLIVMPRSLLFNWEKEFDKFAPQITVSTYYGQTRDWESVKKSQVILTTYGTVRNDIETLKNEEFQYVVLDESQNIKNLMSQTTQAVNMLKSDRRLALSGTPMENNLTELYSLFLFLNPTMFGTADDFNRLYTYPIQKLGDKDASDSLRRKIFPFLLRRIKRDVLKDLPDRIDQTLYVEMTSEQSKLYHDRRKTYLTEIKQTLATQGAAKSQFVMFQALSELRRIASVPESLSDGRVKSPKIEELVGAIRSATENGHKSVVFFNFIAGIELVGEHLEKSGIEFETMTGSTSASQRKSIVTRFQTNPDCKVLLMTLKVGGVGLNLTAADTVFIVEPWWNKAAEEQAINRLHRIGQKATVNALSLITVGTIEEKILQLQEQKKQLFDELISADSASLKSLSEEDIDFILS